jgi:hypothetical protein
MSINNPVWGEGYVPAYQMSATPYLTSSVVALGDIKQINFPYVTRFFTIKNTGNIGSSIAVGFTRTGFTAGASNYFSLTGSESFTAELRTDRLFLSGAVGSSTSFYVVAGLTPIPVAHFVPITASNGFAGVG